MGKSLDKNKVITQREAEPRDRETEPDSVIGDSGFPTYMNQCFICLFTFLRKFKFALVSFRGRLY